jgi:hypothetical protein
MRRNKALEELLSNEGLKDGLNTQMLDRLVEQHANESKRWIPPKDHFSVSKIFYCPRGAFLDRAGVPAMSGAHGLRRMLFGIKIHEMMQELLKRVPGFGYIEERLEYPSLEIVGRIDGCFIDRGVLLEMKTAGGFQTKKMKNGWIPEYYQSQANFYCWLWNKLKADKLHSIWWVVLDRDSLDWIKYEPQLMNEEIALAAVAHCARLNTMWGNCVLPPPKNRCEVSCEYFSICKQAEVLTDILPGGKLCGM